MSETADSAGGAATPRPTDPVTFPLSQPIQVIDTTVSTVTITPPTGRHLMKAGSVMRVVTRPDSDETSIEIQTEGMGKLIAACCNIPQRSVEQMAAGDFMALTNVVMGFLAPTSPAAAPTGTPAS